MPGFFNRLRSLYGHVLQKHTPRKPGVAPRGRYEVVVYVPHQDRWGFFRYCATWGEAFKRTRRLQRQGYRAEMRCV